MAISPTVVKPGVWTEVAADVSALTWLQVSAKVLDADGFPALVEFVAAESAPASDAQGKQLKAGEAATSSTMAELGTSGTLYARSLHYTAVVLSE